MPETNSECVNVCLKIIKYITVLVLIILLVSCSARGTYDAGEKLTPERFDEISREVMATAQTTESDLRIAVTDTSENIIYYWTQGGSVRHNNPECPYLSKSNDIKSGTLDEAIAAGKERDCSLCGVGGNDD